uniref:Uncharacterized protein n=1 Tax=Oryctolagus cuniculus TaxID=9986 RepID=A0A5F9DI88_RABIT
MVPLAYYDQQSVPLDHSCQLTTDNSLTYEYTGEKLNQINNQPVAKTQSLSSHLSVPSLNSSKKVHECSILPSSKSQVTISQGFYNRAMKSPLPHPKYQPTPALDFHWRSPLRPTSRALNSHLSHPKPQTTPSSDFNKTPPSQELSQTALRSQLPFPRFQSASSNLDLCWTSPLLKSNQRVSSSSLSHLQNQESPSFNNVWTPSTLGPNQRAFSSTLLQSKSQKTSSLDGLWASLLEHNQRSLSSPALSIKSQTNEYLRTSPSLEINQRTMSSLLPDSRLSKKPLVISDPNVLSLPLSHSKLRKPLSHSIHQSQSLPLFQSKSQKTVALDRNFRTFSSPFFHSKFQDTTLPNDKHGATDLPSPPLKPNVSGQLLPNSKYCIRNISSSTLSRRLQNKSSFDFCANTESNKKFCGL